MENNHCKEENKENNLNNYGILGKMAGGSVRHTKITLITYKEAKPPAKSLDSASIIGVTGLRMRVNP